MATRYNEEMSKEWIDKARMDTNKAEKGSIGTHLDRVQSLNTKIN